MSGKMPKRLTFQQVVDNAALLGVIVEKSNRGWAEGRYVAWKEGESHTQALAPTLWEIWGEVCELAEVGTV